MVKDQRLEFVGKMTGDFVFAVRNKCLEKRRGVQNLSSVDIAGGSIGAHMAGRACRYLEVLTGEKVRFLLGTAEHLIFQYIFRTNDIFL